MAVRTLSISLLTILLLLGTMLPSALATEHLTITASTPTGPLPLTTSFTAASPSLIESYAWDFTSDGTIDSTEASPAFTYTNKGAFEATLTATITGQDTQATTTVTVEEPKQEIKASVIANPSEGTAPLTVQFTVAAIGKEPLTYAWDTDMDGEPESYEQNPLVTFSTPGKRITRVTITDADSATVQKEVAVNVVEYDSSLTLISFFPTNLHTGENNLTLLITNNGTENVREITAKLVGTNIQHVSSTSIPALKPGEQDSITATITILSEGSIEAIAKVLDKNFPITLNATKKEELNKSAVQSRLDQLKEQFKEQEGVYYGKKSENYVVGEIFEEIKNAQEQLQDAQEKILTGRLEDASISLDLLAISIKDLSDGLAKAQKLKVTPLEWMKENALAITAIIAALGTLSGILIKLKHHAVKVTDKAKKLVEQTTKKTKKNQPAKRKTKKKEEKKEEKETIKKQDDKEHAGASEKGQV